MKGKIIIGLFSLMFVFSSKAQETLIVHGYLGKPNIRVSDNFQKDMFCYLKGNYVVSKNYHETFCTFRVDSVVSGSFPSFNQGTKKTPFNIAVAVINECIILDYNQEYTLRIRQFPNSDYYYIDSLCQVFNNEKYLDKLTEYYENHEQNIELFTKGTLQERFEFFKKDRGYMLYGTSHDDYRYISYLIPFMTSKDTITNYGIDCYDGENDGKAMCETHYYPQLFSEFLYEYFRETSYYGIFRFLALPNRETTDSIGWHEWYDGLFQKDCFSSIKYAQSEHKMISGEMEINYFIRDIKKRKIYIGTRRKSTKESIIWDTEDKSFVLNLDTDELLENQLPESRRYFHSNRNDYSIRNNEIPEYSSYNKHIRLYTLTNNAFYLQEKTIPVNYETENRPATDITAAIHSKNDFFVFGLENINDSNCLRIGKIDRNGEWLIFPKNLYQIPYRCPRNLNYGISSFSFFQSNKNETTLAFTDYAYGVHNGNCAYGKKNDGVMVYKINSSLKVINSSILELGEGLHIRNIHCSKKDNVYLLIVETNWSKQLYYRLLNNDLTPKTDFIKLANHTREYLIEKPIPTSEGFMITWVDNDLSENILRSVMIDKSGKQSNIINITNQNVDNIYNVEFNKNIVDIYLFNENEQILIRKRINKKEYGI